MGKNRVSKPVHEWSLCFHLSFAFCCWYIKLQVLKKQKKESLLQVWSRRPLFYVLWPGIWLWCWRLTSVVVVISLLCDGVSRSDSLKTVTALTRAPSEQRCMAGSCSKWTLLFPPGQTFGPAIIESAFTTFLSHLFCLSISYPAVGGMLEFPLHSTVFSHF